MENIQLTLPSITPLNPIDIGINLAACIIASFLLRYVYVRKSISLSGKYHIGSVIPLLSMVTFLVIMVVKSSLALSLGLVGALSIVRFRTPIKEPEELLYLFLSIALGLGYGAGQTMATTIVFTIILVIVYLWLSRKTTLQAGEFNLMVDWQDAGVAMESIVEIVAKHAKSADLRKYNSKTALQGLFFKVAVDDPSDIGVIDRAIKEVAPDAVLSFSEARPLQ